MRGMCFLYLFCLTTTVAFAQGCADTCPVCPSNGQAYCRNGNWVCPCMDDRPCSTAICNSDGAWDGSRCWFCDWCPGFAPNCDGVWCDLDRCEWNCDSGVPTPILIDVGGDGFELTDARHGVGFDFYGNGRRMGLAWTASGAHNAWLVLDRNGNGKIDSAKEMFGSITEQPPSKDPNGFAALAVFDANHDGVIDINDRIFLELRLWVDHNHNGISEQGE